MSGSPGVGGDMVAFRMKTLAVGSLVVMATATAGVAQMSAGFGVDEATAGFRAKLADGEVASITFLGDSLTFREDSYLPVFRRLMQEKYGDAGAGYQPFSLWTGGGVDAGWNYGVINWDSPPHHGLDGLWAEFLKPVDTYYSASLNAKSDQLRLHYVCRPDGGTIRLYLPGGATADVSTRSDNLQLRTFDYETTPAERRVFFRPFKDGKVLLLGQENRTGAPGVIVNRAANGGWGVQDFLRRNWTFDVQLRLLESDLICIWLGQNDQRFDRATYKPYLRAMLDRVQAASPGSRIMLIGTYDQGSPKLAPLALAMQDVAQERQLGFINMYVAAGPNALFDWFQYVADGVHFNQRGGDYVGTLLFEAFDTGGASLPRRAADLDNNKVLDFGDFLTFFSAFDLQHPLADVDSSGSVDFADFLAFFNEFDS